MPLTEQSAIASMIALRAEIETKLMKNPDYRVYIALGKAIHEVTAPVQAASSIVEAVGAASATSGAAAVGAAISRAPSQPDAVAHILEQYGPQPTSELVPMVIDMGVTVGGSEPLINLSSSISKSGRFRSVRINSVPHWWFKDRELPTVRTAQADIMDFGGSTGVKAPAAEEVDPDRKGGDHGDAAA